MDHINFNMNPKVLDCPVCSKPLQPQVFQCANGHIACPHCCKRVENQCPKCKLSIDIHCPAHESIIASVKVPCTYASLGCEENVSYLHKQTHEDSCPSAPCSCPFLDCKFRGSTDELLSHIRVEQTHSLYTAYYDNIFCHFYNHLATEGPFRVHYNKEDADVMFLLLNGRNIPSGSMLSLVCIRSQYSDSEFQYELTVEVDEDTSFRLKSSVQILRECKGADPAKCLFIPDKLVDFVGGSVYIDLCITKTNH